MKTFLFIFIKFRKLSKLLYVCLKYISIVSLNSLQNIRGFYRKFLKKNKDRKET